MEQKNQHTCGTSSSTYMECCMYFTVNSLSRIINKMAEEAFMQTGLSPSYAFLMMVVLEEGSITQGNLADRLKLAPSTVTRFVDKLVSKGLVIRETEGRTTAISATDKGKETEESIHISWKKLYKDYCDLLGEEFAVKLTADIAKANRMLKE